MGKKYPLEQLVIIKKKKLEEAEKVLREKKEKLLDEEKKLTVVKKEYDKAKKHKTDKLEQLRNALDEGQRSDKLLQMRQYLKIVEEKLKQEEKKLEAQKKQVEKAEEAVEIARKEMVKKQHDVEKLKEHHTDWTKEMMQEIEREEAKEADEMGSARFSIEKQKKKRK